MRTISVSGTKDQSGPRSVDQKEEQIGKAKDYTLLLRFRFKRVLLSLLNLQSPKLENQRDSRLIYSRVR